MGVFFSKLFSAIVGSKEVRILILGLDNAGKTTILCRSYILLSVVCAPWSVVATPEPATASETLPLYPLNYFVWKCMEMVPKWEEQEEHIVASRPRVVLQPHVVIAWRQPRRAGAVGRSPDL